MLLTALTPPLLPQGARAAAAWAKAQSLAPCRDLPAPPPAAGDSRIEEGGDDEGSEGAKGSQAIPPARVDAVPTPATVRDRARHFAALPLYSPGAGGWI